MKFLNPITEEALQQVCLQFNHKGWVVSVSHAFKFPEVGVWKEGDSNSFKEVDTVAQAIYYIDSLEG